MEHAGLYVSDVRSRSLLQQLQGIPQSVVLENSFRQQFLFVPNMQLKRPETPGNPLSTELQLVRSPQWEAAVKTRFYLYPLHPSGAFLQPPSLAATLYLVALRMLHREYHATSRLISTCSTDVPFSDDEMWGIENFKEAKDDAHPDAIACRLRLSLMCVEAKCGDAAPSDDKDFAAYVAKVNNVSTECRLHLDEEITLGTVFEVRLGVL